MSLANSVNMIPPSWCNSPRGYVKHQNLLKHLIYFFEELGILLELPPEYQTHWDYGVDLIINDCINIDFKSFGLREDRLTYTWDSPHWKGKFAPKYSTSLTHYFIHPFGDSIEDWKVAKFNSVNTSIKRDKLNKPIFAPFYWKEDGGVESLSSFALKLPSAG